MTPKYRQSKFQRAAPTYHLASMVQKEMAAYLCELLPSNFTPESVLELGCGTGHLSRVLMDKYSQTPFVLSDVSQSMLVECQNRLVPGNFTGGVEWVMQDAESPFRHKGLQLIASNALVQWIDLGLHLQCVRDSLGGRGFYLFSGFSESNFPELLQILKGMGLKGPLTGLVVTREILGSLLEKHGFQLWKYREMNLSKYYKSPGSFFTQLRNTGSSGNPGRALTPKEVRELAHLYRRHYPFGGGIRATWKPWFALAQKIEN